MLLFDLLEIEVVIQKLAFLLEKITFNSKLSYCCLVFPIVCYPLVKTL